jgi:hypothetical protein
VLPRLLLLVCTVWLACDRAAPSGAPPASTAAPSLAEGAVSPAQAERVDAPPIASWLAGAPPAWLYVDLAAIRAERWPTWARPDPDRPDPLTEALLAADHLLWILPDAAFAARLLVIQGAGVGDAVRAAAADGHDAFAGRDRVATGRNGTPVWRDTPSGWAVHAIHADVVLAGDYGTVLRRATEPLPSPATGSPFSAAVELDLRIAGFAASALARRAGSGPAADALRDLRHIRLALRIGETWQLQGAVRTRPGADETILAAWTARILAELVAARPSDSALREAIAATRVEPGRDGVVLSTELSASAIDELLALVDELPVPRHAPPSRRTP